MRALSLTHSDVTSHGHGIVRAGSRDSILPFLYLGSSPPAPAPCLPCGRVWLPLGWFSFRSPEIEPFSIWLYWISLSYFLVPTCLCISKPHLQFLTFPSGSSSASIKTGECNRYGEGEVYPYLRRPETFISQPPPRKNSFDIQVHSMASCSPKHAATMYLIHAGVP